MTCSNYSKALRHHQIALRKVLDIQESEDGNDNPICGTVKDTQRYRTVFWTLW